MPNPEEALEGMAPDDGYRAVRQRMGDAAWLELSLYDRGEPTLSSFFAPPELASWERFGPKERGEMARLGLALDAVCRYLNTGGSWPELAAALSQMKDAAPGVRDLGGYFYYDGSLNDEGQFEHVFVHEDGRGLRWVEGSFVDPLTVQRLEEEFGVDREGGDEGGAGGDGPGGVQPGKGLPGP